LNRNQTNLQREWKSKVFPISRKKIKEDMRNNLQKTKEEIINEVEQLINISKIIGFEIDERDKQYMTDKMDFL
jgi:hypothetical protein